MNKTFYDDWDGHSKWLSQQRDIRLLAILRVREAQSRLQAALIELDKVDEPEANRDIRDVQYSLNAVVERLGKF